MDLGRRQARRMIMRVPMWVRGKRRPEIEQGVESMNISIRGAYFAADGPFRVGEQIQVRLKMPEEVLPGQKTEWCFTGRVAHVDQLAPSGKSGVGVHFLYYTAAAH
jgi:hypothetical protein